jgi:hypothetical protein
MGRKCDSVVKKSLLAGEKDHLDKATECDTPYQGEE